MMLRRLAPFLLAIPILINSCSGPSKLTEKSEQKLAGGDAWRAWQLATRALDKEPGNPRSRAAATAAGTAIAQEWQRRIHSLAETDSLKAAAQVLDLTEFRENASRYATIPMGAEWPAEERTLRQMAARTHFQRGREAADSGRPKRAYSEFTEAELYVSDYRDVAKRADKALGQALTSVAVVPFRARSAEPSLGIQVAQAWRDNLVQGLAPPAARFTRILGGDAIERTMTLSELEDVTREEAVRLGNEMGANRVVWGSIGAVKSSTRLNLFKDTVCRRVMARDADGHESAHWVDVPIEVVARVRDVTVGVDYEVIAIRSGATIARRHVDRSTSARVVWTSYQPEGDPASYSLVSETVRSADPNRARDVETRWKSVCGDATTLVQVLEARRSAGSSGHYVREALPRFVAGAAFVFLEDLPPAEDLALTTLSRGSAPLQDDLLRLDDIDDVDLYADKPDATSR
ncbi:MAG: hypothetical protein E6K79_02745 [Candidatus Eisenbacteria bacterium]|uniref:Lipoprotein n=1 Tax=Eiseniibacteriota bacterium TaxID=2212470 RepID=A0A538TRQ6_UNCEI|nr:MAG: hypothetical protein E6K79_02745 [Candidatus Eisenbacteria bacterium]